MLDIVQAGVVVCLAIVVCLMVVYAGYLMSDLACKDKDSYK